MKLDFQKADLQKEVYDAALSAGLPVISGNKCCRLLAWLYIYGGYTEESTQNIKLRNDIFYAQKRLNMLGGEIPDADLLPVLQGYMKSVPDSSYHNPPQWVHELCKEYNLKIPKEEA